MAKKQTNSGAKKPSAGAARSTENKEPPSERTAPPSGRTAPPSGKKAAASEKAAAASKRAAAASERTEPSSDRARAGDEGMMEQRIDLLPPSLITDTKESLKNLMDDFRDVTQNYLNTIQRRRKIGAGIRNYGFIEKVADLAEALTLFA